MGTAPVRINQHTSGQGNQKMGSELIKFRSLRKCLTELATPRLQVPQSSEKGPHESRTQISRSSTWLMGAGVSDLWSMNLVLQVLENRNWNLLTGMNFHCQGKEHYPGALLSAGALLTETGSKGEGVISSLLSLSLISMHASFWQRVQGANWQR